jgi:hypothetical protein
MFLVFLRSKSGDMSSARVGAFAQRVTRTIIQREVAVAHEGVDFHNMKVVVFPRPSTAVNLSSFSSSSCLVLRPKNPFAFPFANSIRKVQHALHSSTLRGYESHLRHKSSLSFMHRLPRTLELMAAASSTTIQGIRTSILTLYPRSAGGLSQQSPHRAQFQHYHSIPTNLETLLLLLSTTTTLSCLVHPRPKVLRDRMANPRASEIHHRQNRLQKLRQRKFGFLKLSWPRHGLTPQQLLLWRQSVSRPDLAGALIDFVIVGILLYF